MVGVQMDANRIISYSGSRFCPFSCMIVLGYEKITILYFRTCICGNRHVICLTEEALLKGHTVIQTLLSEASHPKIHTHQFTFTCLIRHSDEGFVCNVH